MSPHLVEAALNHLGLRRSPPNLDYLAALIDGYTTNVPWESASRIAKRAVTIDTGDCPRWPEEFWRDALARGTGGTCFESNYAFLALLDALGFDGALTINDMDPNTACHTAIMLRIGDERRLVDVGLPVYAPLRIHPSTPCVTPSPFHDYTVRPLGNDAYHVERTNHPRTLCFALIDRPVDDGAYRRATTADYGPGGHFLDKVVLCKVIDGVQWRFSSAEAPWRMESFADGARTDHGLGADPASELAARFGINHTVLRDALVVVGREASIRKSSAN